MSENEVTIEKPPRRKRGPKPKRDLDAVVELGALYRAAGSSKLRILIVQIVTSSLSSADGELLRDAVELSRGLGEMQVDLAHGLFDAIDKSNGGDK